MDLTGVVGLAGLIAVLVGVSILSIASMTLTSNIAGTANATRDRNVSIGENADGVEVFRDVKWYSATNADAHSLRKSLVLYPAFVFWFYGVVSLPILGMLTALAFGEATIVESQTGALNVVLADSPAAWATVLFDHNLVDFVLPTATFYCVFVVFSQVRFKKRLYRMYEALESVMSEDRARVLGGD